MVPEILLISSNVYPIGAATTGPVPLPCWSGGATWMASVAQSNDACPVVVKAT